MKIIVSGLKTYSILRRTLTSATMARMPETSAQMARNVVTDPDATLGGRNGPNNHGIAADIRKLLIADPRRYPTIEEIAQALTTSVEEVEEILQSARCLVEGSLDAETASGALSAMVADPKSDDPVGSAEWNEMKALLIDAIQGLPEPDRTVITLYYAEGLLLREISEVLDVTESRVSQIHSRALYGLNRELSARTEARGG